MNSPTENAQTRSATLCGIGTATPEHSILQTDAVLVAQQLGLSERWNSLLPKLYNKSGVLRRRSVLLNQADGVPMDRQSFYRPSSETPKGPTTGARMAEYERHASGLLVSACDCALLDAQLTSDRVTHLITVTCTGFGSPGLDHCAIQSLGLRDDVQRTHVGFMGCHAMVNAMRIAFAIAESEPNAVVLVGAVELCSLHQQYSDDPQQLVANSLFADGAASVVIVGSEVKASTQRLGYRVISTRSKMLPATMDLMSWKIGDHGFEMQLSPTVPALIERALRDDSSHWSMSSQTFQEIVWAVHPGGPRILDAVQAAMNLRDEHMEASRSILRDLGNMSSPTVVFILERLRRSGQLQGSVCVLGFGPGLHMEMMHLAAVV